MIDLHCHILPGLDDGAQTLNDAIRMAEKAVSDGITHILCTPHHNNGKYDNDKYKVIEQVASLQEVLDSREIPLTLFEGQEVRITGEIIDEIEADNVLFVDMNNQYILIEFPTIDVPSYSEKIFYELKTMGITPIIVHPERNSVFIKDPNLLLSYIEAGALAQLTAPSYVGIFGKKIQKTAYTMLEHNLVHMMASDAHNLEKRSFFMKEAYELMEKDFGMEKVTAFQQMAKDIVNGDEVTFPDPLPVEKKKFLFFS